MGIYQNKMKTFALALLFAAATATEWGSPFGDNYSSYGRRGMVMPTGRYSPTGPRRSSLDGPTRRGPSSRYSKSAPRLSRPVGPRNRGYRGGEAQNIVGDCYGDGYGHGRGFNNDDMENLENDMVDTDVEFEIEMEMADKDIENELEDKNDVQTRDGQLWGNGHYSGYGHGYGNSGHGSVRSLALKGNTGLQQKKYDTAYKSGPTGYVAPYDNGTINRGTGYGYGGAFGGYTGEAADNVVADTGKAASNTGYTNGYNKENVGYGYGRNGGYEGMRKNIGESYDNTK